MVVLRKFGTFDLETLDLDLITYLEPIEIQKPPNIDMNPMKKKC
jgi:hypothetical protein